MSNILLNVNGIEVIYNHVILVLKGVSLQVPEAVSYTHLDVYKRQSWCCTRNSTPTTAS